MFQSAKTPAVTPLRHHVGVTSEQSLEDWARLVVRRSSDGTYIPTVREACIEGDDRVRLVLRKRTVAVPIEISLEAAMPGVTYVLEPPAQTSTDIVPIEIRNAPNSSRVIVKASQTLPGALATSVPALRVDLEERETEFLITLVDVSALELSSGSYVLRGADSSRLLQESLLATEEIALDSGVELQAPEDFRTTATTGLLRVGESLTLHGVTLKAERLLVPTAGTFIAGNGPIKAQWLGDATIEPGPIRLSHMTLCLTNVAAQTVNFESENSTIEINPTGDCERYLHTRFSFRAGAVRLGGVTWSPTFAWCELELLPQARVDDASGDVQLLGMPDAYLSGSNGDDGLWVRDITGAADSFHSGELEDVHVDLLRLEHLKLLEAALDRFSPFPTLGPREQPEPGRIELKRRAHFATELARAAERKGARGARQAELRWGAAEARRLAARAEGRRDESRILWAYRCFGYGEKWLPPLCVFLLSTTLLTAIG